MFGVQGGNLGPGAGEQAADRVAGTGASATTRPGLCVALGMRGRGRAPPLSAAVSGIPVLPATPELRNLGKGGRRPHPPGSSPGCWADPYSLPWQGAVGPGRPSPTLGGRANPVWGPGRPLRLDFPI